MTTQRDEPEASAFQYRDEPAAPLHLDNQDLADRIHDDGDEVSEQERHDQDRTEGVQDQNGTEGASVEVEVDLGSDFYSSTDDDIELDLGEPVTASDDEDALDLGPIPAARDEESLNLGELVGSSDDAELNLDFGSDNDDVSDELNLDFTTEAEAAREEAESDAEEDIVARAMAELRAELEGKFGDWYVVHTYSGMENRVAQNLENRVSSLNMEDFIFEIRVPTEEVTELRNGVKKNVKRTVLPGYVLVRMDLTDQSWSTVRHTPSVTGFVGHATQPIPLGLDEVEKMLAPAVIAAAQAAMAGSGGARPRKKKTIEVADFAEGDSVMVVEGPFAGVHATITEMNVHSQRLKALVEILGRETPVDLTFAQIQKV